MISVSARWMRSYQRRCFNPDLGIDDEFGECSGPGLEWPWLAPLGQGLTAAMRLVLEFSAVLRGRSPASATRLPSAWLAERAHSVVVRLRPADGLKVVSRPSESVLLTRDDRGRFVGKAERSLKEA